MARKKIMKQIIKLIDKCITTKHRCMFLILGKKAQDKVVTLHHLLTRCRLSAGMEKPNILWCFKKDSGLKIHKKKHIKRLKNRYAVSKSFWEEETFTHFLLGNHIEFCHFSDTDRVLGQTYGMLVVQDFESLAPNILARITECVEGGGLILFALSNVSSLEDLFTVKMDIHSKYITYSGLEVMPLFNKRFVLSLDNCGDCMVLDDHLKLVLAPEALELEHYECKQMNQMTENATNKYCPVFNLCKTRDQFQALEMLKTCLGASGVQNIVSLTSGRGRGKSATLGLAVAVAVSMHYANVCLTSPHVENLQTLFEFFIKGLAASNLEVGKDFFIQYTSDEPRQIIGVKLAGSPAKSVSYFSPTSHGRCFAADLIVIDEAAVIPLPLVEKWLGISSVFMASTISGYEGTGRSLSLKLVKQLREQNPLFQELELNEAIRYSNDDAIERWVYSLLCLDALSLTKHRDFVLPKPEECNLYLINRATLFGHNRVSERFLQEVVSLFVTSHYRNSPNDLMMMADAPGHQVFCLLSPIAQNLHQLPSVICVIQVCLEGEIPLEHAATATSLSRRGSGDLIPWVISEQFQDKQFASLCGARVVRIATDPDFQGKGYGLRAMQLLLNFFSTPISESSKTVSHTEVSANSLLLRLTEVPHRALDYIGVSFGMTHELARFWKKLNFVPLYVRQTQSEITGEHSCIMIKSLKPDCDKWLAEYYTDFAERFLNLLTTSFSALNPSLAMLIISYENVFLKKQLVPQYLKFLLSQRSLQRLKAYCLQQVDYHLILDLVPTITKLYFLGFLGTLCLSNVQARVLLCIGLQNKSVKMTASELKIEVQMVRGCFRKAVSLMKNFCDKHYFNHNSTSTMEYQNVNSENHFASNSSCSEVNRKKRRIVYEE